MNETGAGLPFGIDSLVMPFLFEGRVTRRRVARMARLRGMGRRFRRRRDVPGIEAPGPEEGQPTTSDEQQWFGDSR